MQLLTLQSTPACREQNISVKKHFIETEILCVLMNNGIILTQPHCYPNALQLSLTYYEAINVAECNCNAGNYFIGTPIDLRPRGIASNEHID